MKRVVKPIATIILYMTLVPALFIFALFCRFMRRNRASPRLLWGVNPILNHKYLSEALSEKFESTSCVIGMSSIAKKNDFDVVLGVKIREKARYLFWMFKSFYAYDIFHISFRGGLMQFGNLVAVEPYLYKTAGIKTVLLAYGGDVSIYDKIQNKAHVHALMSFYPQSFAARKKLIANMMRWTKHADVIIPGMYIPNGFPRWDVTTLSYLSIDSHSFPPPRVREQTDKVIVVHTPNHRIIKGTEYIIEAVNTLQSEGLPVELVLLEGLKNDEVLRILKEDADILIDAIVDVTYGLSGIEGMVSGLPVIANMSTIDWEQDMNLFYRYSFVSECPILNANPESITDTLRTLCTSQKLRNELGRAGRKYIDKYHSYEAARFLFGNIYDKIWFGKSVDLMNLYHPLMSDYVKSDPVQHPLVRNNLPESYFEEVEDDRL